MLTVFQNMKLSKDCYKFAADTGLEVVIIRPPLVYGPGVKGNFYSMMRVVKKGFPLPLGAIKIRPSASQIGLLKQSFQS